MWFLVAYNTGYFSTPKTVLCKTWGVYLAYRVPRVLTVSPGIPMCRYCIKCSIYIKPWIIFYQLVNRVNNEFVLWQQWAQNPSPLSIPMSVLPCFIPQDLYLPTLIKEATILTEWETLRSKPGRLTFPSLSKSGGSNFTKLSGNTPRLPLSSPSHQPTSMQS